MSGFTAYITKGTSGHLNRVWFDDVVVAREDIGPINAAIKYPLPVHKQWQGNSPPNYRIVLAHLLGYEAWPVVDNCFHDPSDSGPITFLGAKLPFLSLTCFDLITSEPASR
jgi:hypothetical protein